MKNAGAPNTALTPQGDVFYDRTDSNNPVFRCYLTQDSLRQLRDVPNAVLTTPKEPADFWLRLLVDGIRNHGQFIFETYPVQNAGDARQEVAARSLLQMDGDILVKINEKVLRRDEDLEVLECHFGWTNWCLEQLGRALSLSPWLRRIQWLPLALGLLSVSFGATSADPMVTTLGFGLSLLFLVGLLLAHDIRRQSPLNIRSLGGPFLAGDISFLVAALYGGEVVSWSDLLSWALAIGPIAGLIPSRLVLTVTEPVIAWYVRRKVRRYI